MKPKIDKTRFGSITIEGEVYRHDVVIDLDGKIRKRKKKLSKRQYGTSHILSLAEAEYVYEDGVEMLIFGNGQFDSARLSDEAGEFFRRVRCRVKLASTPKAIKAWNEASGAVIGLFHVTC